MGRGLLVCFSEFPEAEILGLTVGKVRHNLRALCGAALT
jgi:hypothetical protein